MSDENDTPERVTLRGEEFTVSASKKVSTGQYENYEPHATIKGSIPAPESELDQETRTQVLRELVALHDDIQQVLETTIDRRLAEKPPKIDDPE